MLTISIKATQPMAPVNRQSGVGMIEILVSIMIVSFAMLGLAGLQATTLKYQKVAHFRSIAMQYSGDLTERVRANRAEAILAAAASAYNPAATTYATGAGAAPTCANPILCTTAEIAALDIYNWRINMARGMAGGWGEISRTGTGLFGEPQYTITVYFKEPNKTATDNNLDANCRAAALNAAADKDVRCFNTVFVP